MSQLGLPWRIDTASDPFFGRGGKLMAMSQVEQSLKFELLVPVHSAEQPTACMSFNYHRDHFGTTWNLKTESGAVAHTGCVAFGIDRLALALFATHGLETAALADRSAQSAVDLKFGSDAEHRVFGIGEVAEPRTLRTLEVFCHAAAKKCAEQSGNSAVRIDNDEWSAVPGEISPDRSGEADKVGDVAAIDHLRAGQEALHEPRAKHERVGAFGGLAPQADAAVLGMPREDLLVERIEGGSGLPAASNTFTLSLLNSPCRVGMARKTPSQ